MSALDKSYNITDLEVGHRFITLWGPKVELLKVIGEELYGRLPTYLQEINHPTLSFHCPELFHPFGNPLNAGRRPIRHIHILYPHDVSDEDVHHIVHLLDSQILHRTCKQYTDSIMTDYVLPELQDDDRALEDLYNHSYLTAKRAAQELWALKDFNSDDEG